MLTAELVVQRNWRTPDWLGRRVAAVSHQSDRCRCPGIRMQHQKSACDLDHCICCACIF